MDEPIRLGSGKLYIMEFTGQIPDDQTIETEQNLLGLIKGGATLEYVPSFYKAIDDLGLKSKEIITQEEATLKTGIMTWNAKTLEKLSPTTEINETDSKRTLKIGGIGRNNGKRYLIRFVHPDSVDGDVRVTISGTNQAGFTLSFAKENETVINAEFKAQPLDNEGTLVIYNEEIKAAVSKE